MVFEIRHYLRGNVPLLIEPFVGEIKEKVAEADDKNELSSNKNRAEFPFYGPLVKPEKKLGTYRVWVSSASYAILGAPKSKVFPNRICDFIQFENLACESMNGSKPGETIVQNLNRVSQYARVYNPDVIILYQMTQDINALLKKGFKKGSDTGIAVTTNPLFETNGIKRFLEGASIFGHLREYVSGSIVLQAQLKNEIDDEIKTEFERRLVDFIDTVRKQGTIPVLTTFASSHNFSNISRMPHYSKLTLMRYQQVLSIEGWVNSVVTLNEVIRRVAKEQKVTLIDMDKEVGGKAELFTDFVHLNRQGHEKFAEVIASHIQNSLYAAEVK